MPVPTPFPAPRVLVVDDDAQILRSTVRLLQALGAEAVTADGGRSALALLAAMDPLPDLILTDIWMPDLGGEELLRQVRASEALASIPVVAITGAGTDQPFDRVLAKPFREPELREALRLARRAGDEEDRIGRVAEQEEVGALAGARATPGEAGPLAAGGVVRPRPLRPPPM